MFFAGVTTENKPWRLLRNLLLATMALTGSSFAESPEKQVEALILRAQQGIDQDIVWSLLALGPAAAPYLASFLDLAPQERVHWCQSHSLRPFAMRTNSDQFDWQLEEALRDILRRYPEERCRFLRTQGRGWLFRGALEACDESDVARVLAAWRRQGGEFDPALVDNAHFRGYLEDPACLPLLIGALRRSDTRPGAALQLIRLTGRDAVALKWVETPLLSSRQHDHVLDPKYCEGPGLEASWEAWLQSVTGRLQWDPQAPNPAGRCPGLGPCQFQPGRFTEN